jgi:hypothetical protein
MHIADRDRAEAWAERIAATLPPFTAAEAAEVGRLAATIDARRRATQTDTARRAA